MTLISIALTKSIVSVIACCNLDTLPDILSTMRCKFATLFSRLPVVSFRLASSFSICDIRSATMESGSAICRVAAFLLRVLGALPAVNVGLLLTLVWQFILVGACSDLPTVALAPTIGISSPTLRQAVGELLVDVGPNISL
jgi:hypothetical protein